MASQQQTVEQLFGEALDREGGERAAFLDRACRNAPEVRRRVEELLLADARAGSFLEQPVLSRVPEEMAITLPPFRVGRGGQSSNGARPGLSERFRPGEILAGRFTVVRFIARGGMGEVYEVEDRFLQGVHIALKMILPHIATDAGSSHRFEQEVLLARKVTHPNLCPIYDIARSEERGETFLFLTMKLLAGETLGARLRRPTAVGRDEALSIFRQMTAGIAAIHAAGVVHRDIKPTNVMLDDSGAELCLSIMDFGLARMHESEPTLLPAGQLAGTPGYLAPELLQGHRPTQATDIFALGVLFHQVLTGDRPPSSSTSLAIEPSPALDGAEVPGVFIHCVKEFLADDPRRRTFAFEQMQSAFESRGSAGGWTSLPASAYAARPLLTRRSFAFAGGASLCVLGAGAVWKRNGIYDLLHPLPSKRFVALLNWPPPADARNRPMVMGLIDAMASELARAEAFDHNFFVTSQEFTTPMTTPTQMNEIRESLGANLVLATSGITTDRELRVSLHVLDPASGRTLRSKELRALVDEQFQLPERVVRAAAQLLDVSRYQPDDRRSRVDTDNPEALAAFQAAEALLKQPNDSRLEEAIEKYKIAVEADRHFAVAHARLAGAYTQLYELRRDPSTMVLARANADTAIALDPKSVESHVSLGSYFWETGALADAIHEMGVALSLDPSDTRTMTYQAEIYTEQNRWREAEEVYKRVLRLRPNYWLAYNELGNNYNEQGNYVDALGAYRAAAAAAPKRALPFNNVAAMYFQLGSLGEALAAVDRSIALGPLAGAYQTRSDILRAQGRYAEALKSALESARLNPEDGGGWLEAGDAYSLLPHHAKEAADAYRHAADAQERQLQTEPGNGPGWMLLALYRIKMGEPASALALVKKAESFDAADMYSQLYKVRILELLGRRDEALATLAGLMRKGVTIHQVRAMHDLDALRSDPRFPNPNRSDVVLHANNT